MLLDVMLTTSWRQCVEFAIILSQTNGVEDLGDKLLQLKTVLEDTTGEKWN